MMTSVVLIVKNNNHSKQHFAIFFLGKKKHTFTTLFIVYENALKRMTKNSRMQSRFNSIFDKEAY